MYSENYLKRIKAEQKLDVSEGAKKSLGNPDPKAFAVKKLKRIPGGFKTAIRTPTNKIRQQLAKKRKSSSTE